MDDLKKKIQGIVDIYISGDSTKAESLCKDIISKEPNIVFLHNLLGLIYVAQNKYNLALESYYKGLKIDPQNSQIFNNLGLLYSHDIPDNKKAEEYFKKSINLDPNLPESYNNLGSLYKSIDKFEEAIQYFEMAIKKNKNFFQAYHNLGTAYKAKGDFYKAEENLKKAIKINPGHTNTHRTLSGLIKYNKDTDHLTQLEKLYLKIDSKNVENKSNIAFALGKAYEDIEDFDKSFYFYNEGNNLYKKKINYLFKTDEESFYNTKKIFHKSIFEKYKNTGSKNKMPIFILGMPRSGTTLVEQILSSHKEVYGCGELDFINEIVNRKFGNNSLDLFFKNIVNFDESEFENLGDEYINKIKKIASNKIKATDKLPINFFWIGLIKLILPNSRVIHCFRNSRDNCFSIYKNHFPKGKINYSYDLNNIVNYYNLYNDLMIYWNKILPGFILNIKYEDIINNTENKVHEMLNFCNLKWDNNCLNFYKNKRIIKTASDVQVRSKIYNSSIDIWKKYKKNLDTYLNKLNV